MGGDAIALRKQLDAQTKVKEEEAGRDHGPSVPARQRARAQLGHPGQAEVGDEGTQQVNPFPNDNLALKLMFSFVPKNI